MKKVIMKARTRGSKEEDNNEQKKNREDKELEK